MPSSNKLMVLLIRLYQVMLAPLLGQRCRFYPSCSRYAEQCYNELEFITATRKTLKRLGCCHPLHPGGVDLP